MLTIAVKYKNNILNKFINVCKSDIVFTIAFLAAILSSLVAMPKTSYIDFKVLACLFNLMIVIKAFEKQKLLDKFAVSLINKCSDVHKLSLILVLLCFFCSMLITNDVALITFVPLTIIISNKCKINVGNMIILETLAANIGSSLTPMGNPQNLYIFSKYNLSISQFFSTLVFFTLIGVAWLLILSFRLKNEPIQVSINTIPTENRLKTLIWLVLFIIIILSVFSIINFKIAFILTIFSTFILDKKLILEVDYLLLMTFVSFFIFIGNISNISLVNNYMQSCLSSNTSTYVASITLSQFISNVPCSILLSKFTGNWKALLLGVNIGGIGTLIASLASVISYKLYIKDYPNEVKQYLLKFAGYSFVSLVIFASLNYFLIR